MELYSCKNVYKRANSVLVRNAKYTGEWCWRWEPVAVADGVAVAEKHLPDGPPAVWTWQAEDRQTVARTGEG